MKVRKQTGEFLTYYDGESCSISVHLDGTGQVLLGYLDADGMPIARPVTIPQVWDFLEGTDYMEREEFDAWVMAHLPEPGRGVRKT